jgi:copper chaperone CopZ
MKISIVAFAAVSLLSGAAFAKEATSTLNIAGWHCEGCGDRTANAVKKVKGVKEAVADSEAKKLTVTYDDEVVKEGDLEKAVTALHYKVVKPAPAAAPSAPAAK